MRGCFRLEHGDAATTVTLAVDGKDEASGPFELDRTREVLQLIGRIEDGTCGRADIKEVGSRLWNALLPPEVRARFAIAVALATVADPLLLSLDLPPEDEGTDESRRVEHLPWEALHDPYRKWAWATDPRFVLARARPRQVPPIALGAATRPLRILLVIPGGSRLQTGYEVDHLKRTTTGLRPHVELTLLEDDVPLDRLGAAVRDQRFDVVHWIGHGRCGEEGVELRFNGGPGELWPTAETVAQELVGAGLRLAVFNCCHGEGPPQNHTFAGLGPSLMSIAQIPAVVTMRYEIPDDQAIRFSGALFEELLIKRAGRIDCAVQKARGALRSAEHDRTLRSFITPVLYLEHGCERLFELEVPKAIAAPAVIAAPARLVSLPPKLRESLAQRMCIPIVGPGVHQSLATRGGRRFVGLRELVQEVARRCGYDPQELELLERADEWFPQMLWPRVCGHFETTNEQNRYDLVKVLQSLLASAEIPPPLQALARWNVPGIIYTFIDGFMERAFVRADRLPRIIDRVNQPKGESREPLLINLCGRVSNEESLVLSEADHEQLWDQLQQLNAGADLINLLKPSGRCMLFIGVSPRDIIIRRLARLSGGSKLHRCYFVTSTPPPSADRSYWEEAFSTEWITENAADLIESISSQGVA